MAATPGAQGPPDPLIAPARWPIGLAHLSPTRRFRWANGALLELVGRRWTDIAGTDVLEVLHVAHRTFAARQLDRLLAGELAHVRMERRLVRPDGTSVLASLLVDLVRDAEGEPAALTLVAGEQPHHVVAGLAEQATSAHDDQFELLVRNSSDVVMVLGLDRSHRYVSPSVKRILGYEPEDVLHGDTVSLLHPDDAAWVAGEIAARLHVPGEFRWEVRARPADGGPWRWMEGTSQLLHDDNGDPDSILVNMHDVTERKRAEQLLTAQADVLEQVARGAPLEDTLGAIAAFVEDHGDELRCTVVLVEPDGTLRHAASPTLPSELTDAVNGAAAEPHRSWVGAALAQHEPLIVNDLLAERRWPALRSAAIAHGMRSAWTFPVEIGGRTDRAVGGAVVAYGARAGAPSSAQQHLLHVARRLTTIAVERARAEQALEHRAMHDALTDLPNRALFLDRLEQAIARSRRRGGVVGAIFCDLDRFKVVNDSLGHDAGDQLLRDVAARLTLTLRGGDTAARFGGDEFTVLCEDVDEIDDVVVIAERVAEVLAAPFEVAGRDVFITASIGIAVASAGQKTAARLLREADAAMYRAKECGRARIELFDQAMHDRAVRRLDVETALRRAVAEDQLRVHFQPEIAIADGTVIGAEALVRWEHPVRGLLAPSEFIGIAEDSELIVAIDRVVLRAACRYADRWRRLTPGARGPVIWVNLSGRELERPSFVDEIATLLADEGTEPTSIGVEITESLLMADTESVARTLSSLRDLGVSVALDDFGTGYSSLAYLQRFPIDQVKIDRQFVAGLDAGDYERAIVAAVVRIAGTLGLRTVAEGVESERQLALLADLGCEQVQGFHFAPAMTADEFEDLLRRQPFRRPVRAPAEDLVARA